MKTATEIMPAVARSVTQGTIFRGGKAADYRSHETFGIIITARCDMSQGKVRVVNYLPVVQIRDWAHKDGATILSERVVAQSNGQLSGLYKQKGLPPDIVDVVSHRKILETLQLKPEERARAEKQIAALERCSIPDWKAACELSSGGAKSLLRELVQQKLAGFYFLGRISPDLQFSSHGYVALLREVHSIPYDIATALRGGIDSDETLTAHFNLKDNTDYRMAEAIGVLASPHIEHLIQVFAALYGRIGLPDHPEDTNEHLFSATTAA